jgi:hypothetical protein
MLVRRCYLNPSAFAQFRPYFVCSGFQVVDCPSYTASGKNGADIQMVMDVLDTLEHKTYFDEFILLSGDSDFTPLLYRLRAHDRRTVVLPLGMSATAYRSAADVVLTEETFIKRGLLAEPDQVDTVAPIVAPGPADRARSMKAPKPSDSAGAALAGKDACPAPGKQPEQSRYEEIRNEAALYIRDLVMGSDKPVCAATLASQLRDHFGERIEAKWNGAGTFKAFVLGLTPVPGRRFSVSWADSGWFYNSRKHTLPANPKTAVHSSESDGQPSPCLLADG